MSRFQEILVSVLVLSTFFNGCFSETENNTEIQFDITGTKTQVLLITKTNEKILLGEYPLFPGMTKKNIILNKSGVFFNNGNVMVVVPNKKVSETIHAWNDFNYLCDIILIDKQKKLINTLFGSIDQTINIISTPEDSYGVICFIQEKSIDFYRVSDEGIVGKKINYKFRVDYPDAISIEKNPNNNFIVLDCMKNMEKIIINWDAGLVEQNSFKKW